MSGNKETQICVSCMGPNGPSAHFCAKCGAPLDSYASTAPFESSFAAGSVYRSASERPRKLIVVIGIWLIFSPLAVMGIIIMSSLSFLIGAALIAVPATIIWKTTRNYMKRKRTDERHEA
jgi:hypothetical protein